jgi:RimJ/RimL family protein N-acetyltransferase
VFLHRFVPSAQIVLFSFGGAPELRRWAAIRCRIAASYCRQQEETTSMGDQFDLAQISIVQAQAADLVSVMEILDEAAAWLKARGIQQWPSPHPPHVWQRTTAAIQRGDVYLAYMLLERSPVGTLRLTWTDAYWSSDRELAGYVHGLAIRTHLHGYHLGDALLDWAKDQVRQVNRKVLRLDCLTQNAALCHYYETRGFRLCGQIEDQDYRANLYEQAV